MKLNDSITTYDVAEALQGETGKFEVTSPNGEPISLRPARTLYCQLGVGGSEPNLQPFPRAESSCNLSTTEGRTKRSAAA